MSRKDDLREKIIDLRLRERELQAMVEAATAELLHNRGEQERLKKALVSDAQDSMRLKSVTAKESARGTLARMGRFTISEAIAELGWEKPRLRKLMDAMMCEVPPALVPDGKVFGSTAMFKYTGPPIEQADPVAEREAGELEKVRDWVATQDTRTFTPAEAAHACEMPRSAALRCMRKLEEIGAIADEGPTQDMPIFRVAGAVPDVAIDAPVLSVVPDVAPLSKVPQIQEMLVAAQDAGAEVTASNGHFAIEFLDGQRVIIPAKPQGRSQMMQDRARLRRHGVPV